MPQVAPFPPLSSIDVVVALHRGGFEVTTVTHERVVLTRGDRTIVVERHRILPPPEILLLLRSARVTPEQFLELLAPAPRHASGVRRRLLPGDAKDVPPAADDTLPSKERNPG
jgi:hypothetical protein